MENKFYEKEEVEMGTTTMNIVTTVVPFFSGWSFWYLDRMNLRGADSYETSIKNIGSFSSVHEFWAIYNHLVRPSHLSLSSDLHLFRRGVKPMWEDEANRKGGKFVLRVRKGFSSKLWEDLILAVVGEQFQVGDEICGILISVRLHEDIISLWIKSAASLET